MSVINVEHGDIIKIRFEGKTYEIDTDYDEDDNPLIGIRLLWGEDGDLVPSFDGCDKGEFFFKVEEEKTCCH